MSGEIFKLDFEARLTWKEGWGLRARLIPSRGSITKTEGHGHEVPDWVGWRSASQSLL